MAPVEVPFENCLYCRYYTNGSSLWYCNSSSSSISLLSSYAVSDPAAHIARIRGIYCLQLAVLVTGSSSGISGAALLPKWTSSSEFLSISLIEECLPPLFWALNCSVIGMVWYPITATYRALCFVFCSLL
jgi:hypothetical protein